MKTILIWIGVSYLVQLLLIVFTIYAFNRKIRTIGDLVGALPNVPWILWIPVVGLFLGILSAIFNIFDTLWPKILRIRIRK